MSVSGVDGPGPGPGPHGIDPNDPNIRRMMGLMESCYAKSAMSGVVGFGMGGLFGMFMASMSYDTPYHTAAAAGPSGSPTTAGPGGPGSASFNALPWRRQLALGFRDMGSRSLTTAKNFGMVGALFSGIECGIEGLRAKNDVTNSVTAGCITGAIIARNGGPQAQAVGCAGFAAFSAAIEAWMRMPKEDE